MPRRTPAASSPRSRSATSSTVPSSQWGRAATTSATPSWLPVEARTRPHPPATPAPPAPGAPLPERDAGGVLLVAPAGRQGEALGPGAPADQQGRARALHRPGQGAQVLDLVVAGPEGEGALCAG